MNRPSRPSTITLADRRNGRELEVTLRYLMIASDSPGYGHRAYAEAGSMARRVAKRYRAMTGYSILSHNGVDK